MSNLVDLISEADAELIAADAERSELARLIIEFLHFVPQTNATFEVVRVAAREMLEEVNHLTMTWLQQGRNSGLELLPDDDKTIDRFAALVFENREFLNRAIPRRANLSPQDVDDAFKIGERLAEILQPSTGRNERCQA